MPISIEAGRAGDNHPGIAILFIGIVDHRRTIRLDEYLVDTLLRDLVGHDRKPAAFLVYLWLAGEQARGKKSVQISFQTLAENTGPSRSSAQAAVRWLQRRKLVVAQKANATAVPTYTVQFPWRGRP